MTLEPTPKPFNATYLKDYQPSGFTIDSVDLVIDIFDDYTEVTNTLVITKNAAAGRGSEPLVLDGEALTLISVHMDGRQLSSEEYDLSDTKLTISVEQASFELVIVSRMNPHENKAYSGLYQSKDILCSQCEPEGFRRITYYIDRPDVMSIFTTTLKASQDKYPYLLSNGNCVEKGQIEGGRHFAKWHDPHKKPSYLFAAVAGDFHVERQSFVTKSGREVTLELFVEHTDSHKCDFALESLKQSMHWDEQAYGREYDLDIYMVVAVSHFNMGAMENKGLNIFNSKYVLIDPATATDLDYQLVEAVIGHEYFHNWSGNRVTCRDWFQLSLKEGFTVFREQQFSAAMIGSETVKRMDDVKIMQTRQFVEDAGPMSHPIRPDHFIEINNFYTSTVYNKGAEVIRMLHTLLGESKFRKGSDLYFDRHDGQAVTCDDFIAAMSDANDVDLSHFKRWYSQSGTPVLAVDSQYDELEETFTLTIQQSTPPSLKQPNKEALLIPVKMHLMTASGTVMPVHCEQAERIEANEALLVLDSEVQVFHFTQVKEAPIVSFLNDFSAPVKVEFDQGHKALQALMQFGPNPYNRWQAGQTLMQGAIFAHMSGQPNAFESVLEAIPAMVHEGKKDPGLLARQLTMPSFAAMVAISDGIEPKTLSDALMAMTVEITEKHGALLAELYQGYDLTAAANGTENSNVRSLLNAILLCIVCGNPQTYAPLAKAQFDSTQNMTLKLGALKALTHSESPLKEAALDAFYEQYQADELLINQWLSIQATNPSSDGLKTVEKLLTHPSFDWSTPNKVYALICGFERNETHFLAQEGTGIKLVVEAAIKLDAANPQVAARVVEPLVHYRQYKGPVQTQLKQGLETLSEIKTLSSDVFEMVNTALKS